MPPHHPLRRALASVLLVLMSGAQMVVSSCPSFDPASSATVTATAAAAPAHHAGHDATPSEHDHGDQPTDTHGRGMADCSMVLSCVMAATVGAPTPLETIPAQSSAAPQSLSHSYVGPTLGHLTPPPRTA